LLDHPLLWEKKVNEHWGKKIAGKEALSKFVRAMCLEWGGAKAPKTRIRYTIVVANFQGPIN